MKKEYTKPNMEVVSLKSENIAADPISGANSFQTSSAIKTVTYY